MPFGRPPALRVLTRPFLALTALALLSRAALASQPEVARLLAQAESERHQFHFPEAHWALADALARDPRDPAVALAWGDFWTVLREFDRAETAYAQARDLGARADGLAGMGEAALARNERDTALERFNAALALDADNARALSGLAGLRSVEGKWWDAVTLARRSFERNPDSADTRYRLGYNYFQYGDALRATDWFFKTFDADPYYIFAQMHLGAGRHAVFPDDRVPDPALARPLIVQGARAWERGDLYGAKKLFEQALALDPHSYEARTGMYASLTGIVLDYSPVGHSYRPEYLSEAHTPEVAEAAQFVPEYAQLNDERREVIRRGLYPFRQFLPGMLAKGAKQYILPLDKGLPDIFGGRSGGRGGDLRDWAGIRGVGGLQAASSIEDLEEAVNLGFSTFAHEFAHQLHFNGVSDDQRKRIEELYAGAAQRKQFMDYYAASNSGEYFAQGVEAYVSFVKRPGLRDVHSHTRDELHATDPDLYAFIEQVIAAAPPPLPAPSAGPAPAMGAGGRPGAAPGGAATSGNTLLQAGDLKGAARAFRWVLKDTPGDMNALLGLARAELMLGDPESAQEQLDAVLAKEPNNSMGLALLADLRSRTNPWDQSARAALDALKELPPTMRVLRAQILERLGDDEAAEAECARLLASNKNQPIVHAIRARCLLGLRNGKEALASARMAVLLAPDSADARSTYGDALQWNGDGQAARKQYELALRLNDRFAPAWLGLAWLARSAGDQNGEDRFGSAAVRYSDVGAHVVVRMLKGGRRVEEGGLDMTVAAEVGEFGTGN